MLTILKEAINVGLKLCSNICHSTIHYIMKKHHNEGQRYDRLKWKRIFQTSWKEKIPWVEASCRITKSNVNNIKRGNQCWIKIMQ
jgi:hypothetical protein